MPFDHVSFRYPRAGELARDATGPLVLRRRRTSTSRPRTQLAVVGETGSGKTTFAKLLTRLMDPTEGRVLIDGVPIDTVAFDSLRSRVVMVPQDGALFDGTVADNVRHGRPRPPTSDLELAFLELGLADWVEELPRGLDTVVGERGAGLSAGERQLVALARAYVANPDLLVLDEATSAVDPATEVRLQRALAGLTTRPDHRHHRPPAVDRRAGRRGAGLRRAALVGPTRPPRANWSASARDGVYAGPAPLAGCQPAPREPAADRTLVAGPSPHACIRTRRVALPSVRTAPRHRGAPAASTTGTLAIPEARSLASRRPGRPGPRRRRGDPRERAAGVVATRRRRPGIALLEELIDDTLAAAPAWTMRGGRGQGHPRGTRR